MHRAKISLLLPDLRGGGVERIRMVLAQEFRRHGCNVEFVLAQAVGDLLPEVQREFAIVDLAAPRARNVLIPLSHYLRKSCPDALIAAMWPMTVVAPLAARLASFKGKVLVSEHAMLSEQYMHWGRLHRLALRSTTFAGYRLASARVGVSRGTCQDMAALSYMNPEGFVPIHNPVRPAVQPTPDDLSAVNALWATDGPRILTVGNLKAVKNHQLLLQAFAIMARPDARLILVGQGGNEAALRALASGLGLSDQVVFAGFCPDPSPFYATADLFALSSDHEGFGNVIVEALSFGVPVVSTDCPSGPAEILQGGRFGRLVPVGDAPALARAMEDALESPVDRDALIRRAADFAPEIAASKYLGLLGL